ncbi:MAG: lipopolysaccharide transport periplasmic protein LptA [Zetaproteobacteria bacterium]|nr:lipopolysaccharide transport periplasmic protein LptA [Zetaproteobacteria bacterium]
MANEIAAQPVHVESDTLEVFHEKNSAEFAGEVHLSQGEFELFCDRLLVFYKEKIGGELEKAKAYGHVRIVQGTRKGHSDHASYDYNTGLLIMMDHAEMEDDLGLVRGNMIEHNMQSKQTRVLDQHQGGRVQMTIKQDGKVNP